MILKCIVCEGPVVQNPLAKRKRRIHAGHCENVRYAALKRIRRKLEGTQR